ncbi:Hypothetical predicted protein [Lecanosticta acicola]|uniref:Uncharacterized protein n=1 Tax=Lecanosticta acicola TaxID=111012 RepID=A0AAI9EFE3_9PEZI|nr:Hypothetical predicted protein [Lecanosticta acicola]
MPFMLDINPEQQPQPARSTYSLERWGNAPPGSGPYNNLDVPRELVLEKKHQKMANVQTWYNTAVSAAFRF